MVTALVSFDYTLTNQIDFDLLNESEGQSSQEKKKERSITLHI